MRFFLNSHLGLLRSLRSNENWPLNFEADFHSTSMTSKGLSENSKKMSWDNPVLPIDTKNSIGFFVQFFLS